MLRGRACPTTTSATRQVRRAQLRENEFERFGYTDSKQAVDHSEQGRFRMETILSTTTEGQMRLDQAKELFAQYAEAVRLPGEVEQCKRYRPEGGRSEATSRNAQKQLSSRWQEQQRIVHARRGCSIVANFTSDSEAGVGTGGGRDDGRSN